MTQAFRLVPLRLPAGAVVVHNGFFAVDLARDAAPDSVLAKYLLEDLLYIRAEKRGLRLDVGWTPDMDLAGEYRLTVGGGDGDAPLAEFASRSWAAVAAQIERWLAADGGAALVPLRVVSGWHVDINEFVEERASTRFAGELPRRILFLRKPYGRVDDISIALDWLPGAQAYALTIARAGDAAPLKSYHDTSRERVVAVLEQWVAVAHMLAGASAAAMLAPEGGASC